MYVIILIKNNYINYILIYYVYYIIQNIYCENFRLTRYAHCLEYFISDEAIIMKAKVELWLFLFREISQL